MGGIILAGKIKEMIDRIIQERSQGNPAIAETTKAKLILKGLNPNKFDSSSEDEPAIIEKLHIIARQFNINNLADRKTNIKTVFSTKAFEEESVLDIKSQLKDCNPKILIFFASPSFDQDKLSFMMNKAFENSIVYGCSTAGEIVSGKLLKNSVVAMAINSNIIADAKLEVVENLRENLSLEKAFTSFENYFNENSYEMDTAKYVGIVLIDGVSMKEEAVMDLIGNRTNVYFVGGSAGDNLKFIKTYVYANGRAYTDSAVLVMLKMNEDTEFGIIKTQSFKVLDQVFIANKVNEETREVIEFNNKPAILAYAEAVGADSIENAPGYFMTHPVGLFVGEDNIFIRSPQRVKGTNMVFYCNILKGMEVRLLESTNIIEDTKKAVKNKIHELGSIDGIINFHCIERTLELEKNNLVKEYGEIFSNIPTIGFSTYGEAYIGHINQTSTMLVFRRKNKTMDQTKQLDEITADLKEFNKVLEQEYDERLKVEETLRESERQFRYSVEESPVPIMLYSENGEIIKISKTWTDITGYSIKDISAISEWAEIMHVFKEDPEGAALSRVSHLEGRRNDGEYTVTTRDGEVRIWDFYSSKIGSLKDGRKLFLKVGIDITERKRMEELEKSFEEERRRLNELKEYDRIKTEFLSNISHELRTPINVIFSALQIYELELIRNPAESNKSVNARKYLNIMKQNCYRLLRLVNNIIDITKIDSGYLQINEINYNIVNLIENITLSVADYIKSKGLSIIIDTDVEEKIIACDPEKIERVILNLLSNAVKFTPPGGNIMVNIEDGLENICIRIKDSGRGIPSDKINTVFERFVQVDKSLTRDREGSGIGLSLVKALVELHGGTISIKSGEGSGTEVSIHIPCKLVDKGYDEIECSNEEDKSYIERINIEFSDIYN